MLNEHEKAILNQLAEGKTNYEIGSSLGYNQTELGVQLRFMQAKVGAKTLAHLMHRAWQLGLLGTRTLCLCLAVLGASHISDTKAMRPVRLVRTHVRVARRVEVA